MDAHFGAVDAWNRGGRDGACCTGRIRPIGRIGPILCEAWGFYIAELTTLRVRS
jgi:hypothetical protein